MDEEKQLASEKAKSEALEAAAQDKQLALEDQANMQPQDDPRKAEQWMGTAESRYKPDRAAISKAKYDLSIHQDKLFWSRVQTLIAIQTATLAGVYHLAYTDPNDMTASWSLAVLGVLLTATLWVIAERDQLNRDKSRIESGVPDTPIDPGFPFAVKGRTATRFVIVLMVCADLAVPLWKSTPESERAWRFSLVGIIGVAVLLVVSWRAEVERGRLGKTLEK